jgi:hypothetical protein
MHDSYEVGNSRQSKYQKKCRDWRGQGMKNLQEMNKTRTE